MRTTDVTLSKEYKIGLPDYSNVTIGVSMTWEIDEAEQMDFDKGWDVINQQLDVQASNGLDPAWMAKKEELKDSFKVTVKSPKAQTSFKEI